MNISGCLASIPTTSLYQSWSGNSQKDRDGVKYIFKEFSLDRDTLEKRYREEWRPYMTNEKRYDLTMSLWMDMLGEE
jgi:hypothetical protein